MKNYPILKLIHLSSKCDSSAHAVRLLNWTPRVYRAISFSLRRIFRAISTQDLSDELSNGVLWISLCLFKFPPEAAGKFACRCVGVTFLFDVLFKSSKLLKFLFKKFNLKEEAGELKLLFTQLPTWRTKSTNGIHLTKSTNLVILRGCRTRRQSIRRQCRQARREAGSIGNWRERAKQIKAN